MTNILAEDAVGKAGIDAKNPQASSIEVLYVPGGEHSMRQLRDEVEAKVIVLALQHTGWNRKRAAALLKISYRGLLYKIRRNSITPTTGA
jgi:DNA-binding NtrC family response regulator